MGVFGLWHRQGIATTIVKLILTAATCAALLVAAWSWNPPDRMPGWLVEACAEGVWEC